MFIVNGLDLNFYILAFDFLTASLIVSMDDIIADIPDKLPSFPNADQESCVAHICPVFFGVETLVKQILVLEIRLSYAYATIK